MKPILAAQECGTEPRNALRVPAKRPAHVCRDWGKNYACNRRAGHAGRHAFIWYGLGGIVREVWG